MPPLRPSIRSFILCILLLAMAAGTSGCATKTAARADGALALKGKVQSISLEEGILVLKPPRGEAVMFRLGPATVYERLQPEEIETGQRLEVVYREEDLENSALEIRALQEGSC